MGKRQLLEALLLDGIRTFQVYVHAKKPGKRQRLDETASYPRG